MTEKAKQARLQVLEALVTKYEALAQSPDISTDEQKYYACCLDRAKTEISLLTPKP